MAYVPSKDQRQYQRPLWEKNRDGTTGKLLAHNCAKCGKNCDGDAPGTWFERADQRGTWVWVCCECRP